MSINGSPEDNGHGVFLLVGMFFLMIGGMGDKWKASAVGIGLIVFFLICQIQSEFGSKR
jgi:hypothetical protein